MSIVIDASVTIAWIFAAERAEGPRLALRRVVAEGAVVPSLWRLEVANVLQVAVRRGRCDQSYADRSLDRLKRLAIAIDQETDTHAWAETRRLALMKGLTLYDAAYLELALRLDRPLASRDVALAAAASRSGLDVIG